MIEIIVYSIVLSASLLLLLICGETLASKLSCSSRFTKWWRKHIVGIKD